MNRGVLSSTVKAVLIGLLISVLYLGILEPFSLLEVPRLKSQDLFFKLRHLLTQPPSVLNDMMLITIDDESIEKLRTRWPFRRHVYAELIAKLIPYQPRLIALDLIFSGKGDPADDFLLAHTVGESGNVILASYVDGDGNLITPIEELRTSALGFGVVNKSLDRDLYVRRANLFYRDEKGNVVGWPWEIEILIALFKLDRGTYQAGPRGLQFAQAGKDHPLVITSFDSRGVMINYRFTLEDVPHRSLWEVIGAEDLETQFRGKTVLVGATSRLLHDDYHTPLGLMPGVMVNLNLLVNTLTGDFLRKIPFPIDLFAIFLSAFLAACLSLRLDVLRGLTILTLSSVVMAAGYFLLFLNRFIGDSLTPFLSAWSVFLSLSLYRYFRTFVENLQLKGKVVTDSLTGLYNRRVLESQIDTELEKMANQKGARKTDTLHELSVLMIDIDNFKQINDTYGHQFGDDVLKNVSYTIKENTRKDDMASRFGGEEFCVVLPHTTKEEARQIGEKIRVGVSEKEFNYVNKVARFTVSVGVASAKEDSLFASRGLIGGADAALYEAKRAGKNRVELYKKVK